MTYARRRRLTVVAVIVVGTIIYLSYGSYHTNSTARTLPQLTYENTQLALSTVETLDIKGRAPRNNYSRKQFGAGWLETDSCDTRNRILARDLENVVVGEDGCSILRGKLSDPYTAKTIEFQRGSDTSDLVQIDHVVALADAWQKGAQTMAAEQRVAFANDPLNLLAVDGPTNVNKGSGDTATWLPPNKPFRCRYVARQIAVKKKHGVWVTQAEYEAMKRVLQSCPDQVLPIEVTP